jgi:hypothetical protein
MPMFVGWMSPTSSLSSGISAVMFSALLGYYFETA